MVSTFQEEEINSIDFLLNDDCWMTKVPTFVKLIWFHAFQMIETTSSKTKMTLLLSSDGKNFLRQLTSWISFSMVMIFLCMFVLFLAQIKVHFLNGPLHVSCDLNYHLIESSSISDFWKVRLFRISGTVEVHCETGRNL